MRCIDAIEGSAKNIITKFHQVFMDNNPDDSEYIRNVKAVIDGTGEFVKANKEIIHDPDILQKVLYEFSKELWLSKLRERIEKKPESNESTEAESEQIDYYEYYFDYIYANGIYPK